MLLYKWAFNRTLKRNGGQQQYLHHSMRQCYWQHRVTSETAIFICLFCNLNVHYCLFTTIWPVFLETHCSETKYWIDRQNNWPPTLCSCYFSKDQTLTHTFPSSHVVPALSCCLSFGNSWAALTKVSFPRHSATRFLVPSSWHSQFWNSKVQIESTWGERLGAGQALQTEREREKVIQQVDRRGRVEHFTKL